MGMLSKYTLTELLATIDEFHKLKQYYRYAILTEIIQRFISLKKEYNKNKS
ncbi:MAG: hypothetical protein WC319_12230 [Candidatus Paceibacterota bacterium]|jgi:hypothetical protein